MTIYYFIMNFASVINWWDTPYLEKDGNTSTAKASSSITIACVPGRWCVVALCDAYMHRKKQRVLYPDYWRPPGSIPDYGSYKRIYFFLFYQSYIALVKKLMAVFLKVGEFTASTVGAASLLLTEIHLEDSDMKLNSNKISLWLYWPPTVV